MDKGCTNESLVRLKKIELGLDEGKELLIERGAAQARILAHSGDCVVHFQLEKVECHVFFGGKVVEYGAFSDARAARDGLGGGCVKAFLLKKGERGFDNAAADGLAILLAPAFGRSAPARRT